MRIAALVLGILGGLLAAFLGIKWLGDASEASKTLEALRSSGADTSQIDGLVRGGYCLLLALVLGVTGGLLTLKDKGKLGGAMMIFGAVLPAFFAGGKVLVF